MMRAVVLLLFLPCLFAASQPRRLQASVFKVGSEWVVGEVDEAAAATADFNDTITTNGWTTLNITTNAAYPDSEQAYAAGLLEGSLLHDYISKYYYNMVVGNYGWKTQEEVPPNLINYFNTNQAYMDATIAANPTDPYWIQVGCMQAQLKGMYTGYNNASTTKMTYLQFVVLVSGGDLFELSTKYGTSPPKFQRGPPLSVIEKGHCSALFKMQDNMTEIYFGHTSWYTYNCMLRVMKRYTFNYKSAPVKSIHFSSYPGVLSSFDDFYVGSTGLVTIETSIGINNNSLYDYIQPTDQLSYWVRVMVANRLATSAENWCQTLAKFNGGTYNNQWMVLDTTQLNATAGVPLPAGSFYVLDQYPGPYIEWSDLTNVLNFGHFPSYNIPYHYNLWVVSGYAAGGWSYWTAPRANIFRRDAGAVESLAQFQSIMRYNNWEHDPLSSGPWDAIAARGDLGPKAQASCSGGYDTKVSSVSLVKQQQSIVAINGPTYQQQPVFQFSTTQASCFAPQGIPDRWDFPWVQF